MRCPNCQNENPPNLSTCDWCGAPLPRARKSGTLVEGSAPPPSGPAVSGPSEKRKTLYEPSSAPSYTRPPADDFFGNPPPSRPAPQDPDDPFAQSIRPQPPAPAAPPPRAAPAPAPPPPPSYDPPPVAPAPRRSAGHHSRTIVENPAPTGRRLRGALFVFRGQDATSGEICPLHEGRNSLGRSEDRDIVLDDGRVSSEHGFLFIRQDRHTYVDTSTNGSRVDGKIVYGEQVEVRSGSVIEAGSLRLVIVTIPPEALNA